MASPLRQLATLISSSVDTIEREFCANGLSFPALDVPVNVKGQEEALARSTEVAEASRLIVAAAAQLSAMVHPPPLYVIERGITVRTTLRMYPRYKSSSQYAVLHCRGAERCRLDGRCRASSRDRAAGVPLANSGRAL